VPQYHPPLYQVKGDEIGEYEMLGYEGIDNDRDGLVNEDLIGTYDPNRDWGWNWQPTMFKMVRYFIQARFLKLAQ
jgi:hypothetical protein